MTVEEILFAVVLTILGGFVVSLYFYYKSKIDNLNAERKKQIDNLNAERKKHLELSIMQRLESIPKILGKYKQKYENLCKGNIDLDLAEASSLWSDMFKGTEIIFLRATSYIDPSIWDDEFMRKYEGEQRKVIENIEKFKQQDKQKYNDIAMKIKQRVQQQYDVFNFFDINFERIFIIMSHQVLNPEILRKLAERISSQSAYMNVRIVFEGDIPMEDVRDFGIAIAQEGEPLVYELILGAGNKLYGGKIFTQPDKIVEAFVRYTSLRAKSTEIPKNARVSDVLDKINQICGSGIDPEVMKKAKVAEPHKCLSCFLSTEIIMGLMDEQEWKRLPDRVDNLDVKGFCRRIAQKYKGRDWRTFSDDEKRWFEMIEVENKTVLKYVNDNREKLKRIIEVGCGPGRMISQILRIKDYMYDEIVGIEGNKEMYDVAYNRFLEYGKVNIYNMTVREKLPYQDDYFDFCINAMNIVGWQNGREKEWLNEMLRCSNTVFFTLYKKGLEDERVEMYKKRPHGPTGIRVDDKTKQIQLIDCATNPGVYSKSYEIKEVEKICKEVASRYEPEYDVKYEIDDRSNNLLYLCFISKTKKI